MDFSWLTRETLFAGAAVIVSLIRYSKYFISIFKRQTRPHFFSWFTWGIMVAIGTAAQFKVDGGLSAWVLLIVALGCFAISFLSIFYGEKTITRGDWVTFIGALIIIPVWLISHNPILTFILLMFIDVLSYYPTWRKMWVDPWSEPTDGFFWAGLRYFMTLWAVPDFTLVMLLYPFWLMASDWGTGVYMIARRRYLKRATA